MRQASVMIVVKDGLVLAVSRRYDSTKFGLPGGKVEPGESLEAAAIRETFEETGIVVKSCKKIYMREEPASLPGGEPFFAHAFLALDWVDSPLTESEEGVVKWISWDELISPNGAFPQYNYDTLNALKILFPNIYIQGE